MNKHFLFISLLSFIYQLLLSFAIELEQNILDISDFTFYYQTYHYSFDSLSTETQIIYNDDLQTNITIDFDDKIISLIIDNNQSFNILNDNEWNEISLISSIEEDINIDEDDDEEDIINVSNKRSLLRYRKHRHRHRHRHYGHSRVKFTGVRHGRKWRDAKNYCKLTRRGILATIKNAGENNKVTRECGKMGNKWHCWIGLRRYD